VDRGSVCTQAALLFQQVVEAEADIIALQEVTREFVELLNRSGIVAVDPGNGGRSQGPGMDAIPRGGQFELVVEPEMGPLKPSGTALLSRWPITAVVHQPFEVGDMDRGLLACVVAVPRSGGRQPTAVAVGTTHLESPEGAGAKDNFKERREQCAAAIAGLGRLEADCAVLLGDFNSTRGVDEEAFLQPPFRDAWLVDRPGDPGFTYDANRNPNARGYQSRLDKVAFANTTTDDGGAALAVKRSELIGVLPPPRVHADPMSTPPPPSSPLLHASDHYGLCVQFSLTNTR
jgi:poly(A) polymerase